MWKSVLLIRCDWPGCSRQKVIKNTVAPAPRGWAEAVNYKTSFGQTVHLCPKHAKEPRPDWWPEEES